MRIEASEVYCIRLSLNLRDRIPKTSTIGGLLMNHAKIAHQTEEASSPIQADRQLPSCAAHRWQFKDLGLLPLRSATSTTPASVDTPILGVVWQLSPRPCSPRAVSPSCRWWVYFSRLRGVAVSGGLAPPPPAPSHPCVAARLRHGARVCAACRPRGGGHGHLFLSRRRRQLLPSWPPCSRYRVARDTAARPADACCPPRDADGGGIPPPA